MGDDFAGRSRSQVDRRGRARHESALELDGGGEYRPLLPLTYDRAGRNRLLAGRRPDRAGAEAGGAMGVRQRRLTLGRMMAVIGVAALILALRRVDSAPAVSMCVFAACTWYLASRRFAEAMAQRAAEGLTTSRAQRARILVEGHMPRRGGHRAPGWRVPGRLLWVHGGDSRHDHCEELEPRLRSLAHDDGSGHRDRVRAVRRVDCQTLGWSHRRTETDCLGETPSGTGSVLSQA